MIKYEVYNVIMLHNLEDFLTAKGFDSKSIWNAFAEEAENDSYNYWDLDRLHDAIENVRYYENSSAEAIYNCVIEAIQNKEIPEEFLLNIFW